MRVRYSTRISSVGKAVFWGHGMDGWQGFVCLFVSLVIREGPVLEVDFELWWGV